ncbi:cell division protein FtsL [Palleronia sp. KMU-117]|uniref:cell division protein FtsL n=1 Tax=Palleronia sp. KMU-117 TaxID=3434108 RepID=UPI003D71D300
MRSVFFIAVALCVVGLASWAYQENYRTQDSLREVERLNAEIASLRETLGVLRAEWAYLNRPDRLRDLSDLNFDRLGLLPLSPDQFGQVDQITYPMPDDWSVTDSIEVRGDLESFP